VPAALIAAAEEAAAELPFPPVVFGVGAFVGLVALLAFVFAFRHAGSKH
jgi:hypothetical protein